MRAAALATTAAALIAAAPAAAQEQQPEPAAAAPVQTTLALKVERIGPTATVLVGSKIRVRGTTGAFADGETVTLRFYMNDRKVRVKRVALQPRAGGRGGFLLSHRPARTGRLRVTATKAATPLLDALHARGHKLVDVLPRSVDADSHPRAIRMLQRWLARNGYVVGRRRVFDARTARAVLAFRKVTGMRRTTDASVHVMRRLARGQGGFKVRRPDHGRHIEADLSRQVMAFVDGRRVERIYHVSSGAPSTPTVVGTFKVYLKTPGTNAKGMVHSAYFIRGYATHGYASVPIFPASHGCLRVPIPDAKSIFNWIRVGTVVDVYR